MDALERLTAYLCSNPGNEHMDEQYAVFAARLLRQHAHELAEKIRSELPETVKERLGGGIWTITTVPTAKQAADLIDPEVQ